MQSFFNFDAWNFYLSLFCIIYLFLRTQAVSNKTQCSDILTNIRTLFDKSPVIRQKGESKNGCFKKTKHAKFPDKRTFLTCWYAHTYVCVSGGKKYSFFGKFGVLCFLETPVLRFALLPYYRQNEIRKITNCCSEKFWKFSKDISSGSLYLILQKIGRPVGEGLTCLQQQTLICFSNAKWNSGWIFLKKISVRTTMS